jgi:GxxExxY protein
MLRVSSPLSVEDERLVTRAMDCAFTVHRTLGPGFREKIYARAYRLELDANGLRFESEKPILVKYREWKIPGQTIDLLIEGVVLVEMKTVPRLRPIHHAQVLSYLKTLDLRVGLLMNFNVPVLKAGLQRVVHGQLRAHVPNDCCVVPSCSGGRVSFIDQRASPHSRHLRVPPRLPP